MKLTPTEGWGFTSGSELRHYFSARRSACGSWYRLTQDGPLEHLSDAAILAMVGSGDSNVCLACLDARQEQPRPREP